jgi:hypothetical protein
MAATAANQDLYLNAQVIISHTGTHPVIGAPLSVKADASHYNLYLEENSGTEAWRIGVNAAGDLTFYDDAAAVVTFLDGGNAGFGTTVPGAKLHVEDSSADSVVPFLVYGGSAANNNAKTVAIQLQGLASTYSSVAKIVSGHETSGSSKASFLAFQTRESGGSTTEKVRISADGNVTISTLAAGATNTVVTHAAGVLQTRTIDSRVWGTSLVDLANGADNRVVTATGANSFNGEANLTFDGATLSVNGDISLPSTGVIYFGPNAENDSWRIVRSGNNLAFERREADAWVQKAAIAA